MIANLFASIGVVVTGTGIAVWGVRRWRDAPDWRMQARYLRFRRAHLTRKIEKLYRSGTRCPNCLRWPWDCDAEQKWDMTVQPAEMTCVGCGHTSYWVDGPGVMLSVLPPPAPITIG